MDFARIIPLNSILLETNTGTSLTPTPTASHGARMKKKRGKFLTHWIEIDAQHVFSIINDVNHMRFVNSFTLRSRYWPLVLCLTLFVNCLTPYKTKRECARNHNKHRFEVDF